MQECIITSTIKMMNFRFTVEDVGNQKVNLGNVQQSHPEDDQTQKSLLRKRMLCPRERMLGQRGVATSRGPYGTSPAP